MDEPSGHGFTGYHWFGVSPKVVVISRLDPGQLVSSLPQVAVGGPQIRDRPGPERSVSCRLGFPKRLFTVWQLASPRERNLRESQGGSCNASVLVFEVFFFIVVKNICVYIICYSTIFLSVQVSSI